MSCGSLPPVPGLIPISALRKSPSCSNNNDLRECTPCAVQKEVMGEQRSRRTGSQPSVDLIDIARRSRACSTTPQAPSGKAERHRKSDRRRGEHRGGRKRSVSKRRETEDKCVNPRVNPIFVWVRQEDTHIVDVKCEDYDKRNRIVLTKTAQGWRAIPRTETLVPNLKAAATPTTEEDHHMRKTRKTHHHHKVKRKSAAVQVDEVHVDDDPPTWNVPVNIESHLPSHTIQVHRSPEQASATPSENVNMSSSVERDYSAHSAHSAQASPAECSASKMCDVSPLDNLLAVAELEFNQQIQTEAWCESVDMKDADVVSIDASKIEAELPVIAPGDTFDSDEEKDCDYNEDDENNIAMDDILTRLEQSLQSPDALCVEIEGMKEQIDESDEKPPEEEENIDDYNYEDFLEKEEEEEEEEEPKEEEPVGSTTITEEKPTDLSTSKKVCLTINLPEDDLLPTDLSLPKNKLSPRPSSRCSETIQSPQPSGLPAVPPQSPDVQSKTAYLESLLSSTSQKVSLNSEVTITRQKEPLDFGKCRKSASPTVTCSEEVNSSSEPEVKKLKLDDITLRTMLDAKDETKPLKTTPKAAETSRLLELLTSESEPDALTQLKQLHSDPNVNLPDPMLVPKDKLSQILVTPGKEIPRLLQQRPELRLPEALAFPHLLQDPDILVITLEQLETIIRKQTLSLSAEKVKQINNSAPPAVKKAPPEAEVNLKSVMEKPKQPKHHAAAGGVRINELDHSLNQMMWLPYLQQLEVAAMAFGNGADFLKMLSSAFPPSYSTPDVLGMNRFPPGFPVQPPPIWHETPNLQRAQFERHCNKNAYRDYMEKLKPPSHKYSKYGAASSSSSAVYHNHNHNLPFMNVPATYQPPRHNLQIPQYNALLAQKTPTTYHPKSNGKTSPSSSCDAKLANFYGARMPSGNQRLYNQKLGHSHKSKVPAFNTLEGLSKTLTSHETFSGSSGNKKNSELIVTQPMDLSGVNAGKVRKQNFCTDNFAKSLKFDDIPEVGSTTASIEDMTAHMQESQKHLWHPLFGNQKSSSNPWNWSTVTATGE